MNKLAKLTFPIKGWGYFIKYGFVTREKRKKPWLLLLTFCLFVLLFAAVQACKLQRGRLRGSGKNGEQMAKVYPPRTLHGTFAVVVPSNNGNSYVAHFTFGIEISEDLQLASFNSCVDSDGGLANLSLKEKRYNVKPDTKVRLTQNRTGLGASPKNTELALLPGVAKRPAAAVAGVEKVTEGISNHLPELSVPLQCAAQISEKLFKNQVGRRTQSAGALPSDLPSGLSSGQPLGGPTQIPLVGAAQEKNSVALEKSSPALNADEWHFTSEVEPKRNEQLRLVIKANQAGWQVEEIDYYGLKAYAEETTTLAMWTP